MQGLYPHPRGDLIFPLLVQLITAVILFNTAAVPLVVAFIFLLHLFPAAYFFVSPLGFDSLPLLSVSFWFLVLRIRFVSPLGFDSLPLLSVSFWFLVLRIRVYSYNTRASSYVCVVPSASISLSASHLPLSQ